MTVPNPYLDEFLATAPPASVPPELRKLTMARYQLRQVLVARYAWAIPSQEAIDLLARHSPLIEVGAGTGYWAWLVRQAGADILAFDRFPPPDPRNRWHAGVEPWSAVEPGGPDVASAHPDRTLFLCWPPEDEPFGEEALAAYRGETVVFIGEPGRPGELTPLLQELDRWDLLETADLPQWEGVRDRLFVLRRPRRLRGSKGGR